MVIQSIRFFLVGFLVFLSGHIYANQSDSVGIQNEVTEKIRNIIVDQHQFHGLAKFYNIATCVILHEDKSIEDCEIQKYVLQENQHMLFLGRYDVLDLSGNGTEVELNELDGLYQNLMVNSTTKTNVQIYKKNQIAEKHNGLAHLQYSHLWKPFAWLCILIEKVFLFIQSIFSTSWGITIVLFAILFKLLLLPINIWTNKQQKEVFELQAKLAPKIREIKQKYKGEEAHNKFLALHKEHGVSTAYSMKPMVSLFIQIPFLIAIFNVLGEMDILRGESFLWIKDLAYPDALFTFGFTIPFLGNTFNLLPILMTLVAVFATFFYQISSLSVEDCKRQKTKLYLLAFAFLILFYPFPASMVFYWTLVNVLQIIQQRYVKS